MLTECSAASRSAGDRFDSQAVCYKARGEKPETCPITADYATTGRRARRSLLSYRARVRARGRLDMVAAETDWDFIGVAPRTGDLMD